VGVGLAPFLLQGDEDVAGERVHVTSAVMRVTTTLAAEHPLLQTIRRIFCGPRSGKQAGARVRLVAPKHLRPRRRSDDGRRATRRRSARGDEVGDRARHRDLADAVLVDHVGCRLIAAVVGAHALERVGTDVEEGDHSARLGARRQVAEGGAGIAGVNVAAVAERAADAEGPHRRLAAAAGHDGAKVPMVAGVLEDRVEAGVDHQPGLSRDAAGAELHDLGLLGLDATHEDGGIARDRAPGFQVELQV